MTGAGSTGCKGCEQASLLAIGRGGWGGCPVCMAIAGAGVVIGWSFTLSFWMLYPDPSIPPILAAISLGFSALLAAHVAAYRRSATKQDS